jgi:hypothetical protein
MIQTAFDELTRQGSVTHKYLLNDLHIKRSAAVCALLAQLPEVEVSNEPVCLRVRRDASRLQSPARSRPTFILTWNPNNWDFDDGEYDAHVAATARGEFVAGGWSTGIRNSGIAPGDRAYLLRQHADRGIVAAGEFSSEIVEDSHWDGSGAVANFADVRWETFLPIGDRLPVEDLKRMVDAAWDRMQGSGVKLRSEAADDLDELWNEHLLALGRTIE